MLLFILLSVASFSFDHGVSGADTDKVFVMEGASVSLNTGVVKTLQQKIKWYFNDTRIAQINRDQSQICTDDQCKERFRDRLKLDHQTGSLTITNTRNTDSGEYTLRIISSRSDSEKIFIVSVHDVPAAGSDEIKINKGESFTLDPGGGKKNGVIMWCFNGPRVTEITGDQSQICTDVQYNGRFRNRLKLDHQTGSLTITNTTDTDTGLYRAWTRSSSSRRLQSVEKNGFMKQEKSFYVTINDSGPSSGFSVVAVLVPVVAVAVAVLIYRLGSFRKGLRQGSHCVATDIN